VVKQLAVLRSHLQGIPMRTRAAWFLGTGMVLATIHNPSQIGISDDGGYALIFIPAIGTTMVIAAAFFLYRRGETTLGRRVI